MTMRAFILSSIIAIAAIALSSCKSSEENAAMITFMAEKDISLKTAELLIQDTFVAESASGKIVCGRYAEDLFIHLTDDRIISKADNSEYFDFFWLICSQKKPEEAIIAERGAEDFSKIMEASQTRINDNILTSQQLPKKTWSLSVGKSDIDDSPLVSLGVRSEEEVEGHLSNDRVRPWLILRCAENVTSLIINWNRFIGIDSTTMITRVDQEKAVTDNWDISTGRDAVFSRKAVTFTKSLFGKDKLLARITPYGADPVTVTFQISNLESEIEPLRKACSW